MQHTLCSKLCCLLLAALLGAALVVPAFGAGPEPELKTLTLVRTYQSEAEFQAANAKLLRAEHPIVDDGESIKFIDTETGNVLKQLKKEPTFQQIKSALTATERQQMADSVNPKTFIKRFHEYFIPSSYESEPYVQVVEIETAISEHTEGEGYSKLLSSTIYNQQGERVVDLPLDTDRITLAPNRQNFVAHTVSPVRDGEFLYFYTENGKVVNKVPFPHGGGTKIAYSADSDYLAVWSIWGYEFFVLTKTGEFVLKGSARPYITAENNDLSNVFVSKQAEYILLCMGRNEILLRQDGSAQWTMPHPKGYKVASAYFDNSHGQVYISTSFPGIKSNYPGWLRVVNLVDGTVLDELMPIYTYAITEQALYVNKGGYYEEYRIQ